MTGENEPLPVSVVTGFLGSGKTTLLSRLIRQPGMEKTAVVINEFGEIGLDHELVAASSDENVMVMDSGCICCSIRGELAETLRDLFVRRAREEIPAFDRVVIETTGLADPAPVLHTLMADPMVAACFRLDSVVATVDGVHGDGQLDRHEESLKQAAMADRLLLTKTDLAGEESLAMLEGRLSGINPSAPRYRAVHGEIDPDRLFGAGLYDPATKSVDVRNWLREQAFEAAEHDGHDHSHDDHEHGHDHDHSTHRHDDRFDSFCLRRDGARSWNCWVGFLEALITSHGDRLLRLKGILNVAGLETPVAVHGVQHMFHPPAILEAWPSDDRTSRIVFIGDGLSQAGVEKMLDAWIEADERANP